LRIAFNADADIVVVVEKAYYLMDCYCKGAATAMAQNDFRGAAAL